MKIFNQKRNMAASQPILNSMPVANWTNWTVYKSTKEGYKASGWVYRAISLISRAAASVPWIVLDAEGNGYPEHPISKLMKRPNPQISRQDFFELLTMWLEISGEAYIKRIFVGKSTKEMWPVSPDRICPYSSADIDMLIGGYEILTESGVRTKTEDYTTDNTIQLKLIDPANPIRGISPLMAAAKIVDIDNEQKEWNKSAMQNRGVLDGVFIFDRDIDQSTFDILKKMIKDRFGGSKHAREPGIIGSNARYTQMSLSPVEMDFLASRKFNRDEIYAIYGIPSQLAGAMEFSTMNNFKESLGVLWRMTVIPLLEDIKDALNHDLYLELDNGKYIVEYDVSNVEALRDNEETKSKTARNYYDMGIPVSILNHKFNLGIEEYPGWDKSKPTPTQGQPQDSSLADSAVRGNSPKEVKNAFALIPFEKRSIEDEMNLKDSISEGAGLITFKKLLKQQQADVFDAIDNDGHIESAVLKSHDDWIFAMNKLALFTAKKFFKTITIRSNGPVEFRDSSANKAEIENEISKYMDEQGFILIDKSKIDETTVKLIKDQVQNGIIEGMTIEAIKQSINDSGIFSTDRALRISRTETGTSSSVGQLVAGKVSGANRKIWHTAGHEVRTAHKHRSGENVGINDSFSVQFSGLPPRFPGDPRIAAADRINCRCAMSFEVRQGLNENGDIGTGEIGDIKYPLYDEGDPLAAIHKGAVDYCLNNAAKAVKGTEFGFDYDADGKVILKSEGEPGAYGIGYTKKEISKLKNAKHPVTLVHNHTGNHSLSDEDFRFANYVDGTIYAVTPSGYSFAGKMVDPEMFEKYYDAIHDDVTKYMLKGIKSKTFTFDESQTLQHHLINAVLDEGKIVKYQAVGLEMTGDVALFINKAKAEIAKDLGISEAKIAEWNYDELIKNTNKLSSTFTKALNEFENLLNNKQLAALDSYIAQGYAEINKTLMAGEINSRVEAIDSIFYGKEIQEIKNDMLVFRGLSNFEGFENLNVGDIFVNKGYMSATTYSDIATEFAIHNSKIPGLRIDIKIKTGTKAIQIGGYEGELIFNRNSQLKILKKYSDTTDDGELLNYIEAELL